MSAGFTEHLRTTAPLGSEPRTLVDNPHAKNPPEVRGRHRPEELIYLMLLLVITSFNAHRMSHSEITELMGSKLLKSTHP